MNENWITYRTNDLAQTEKKTKDHKIKNRIPVKMTII